jgi:hypothetical protein
VRTPGWFGFLCLLAAVCAAAPRAADAGSRPLDFEVVVVSSGSNLAAGDYVFRDQESWQAFCVASSAGGPGQICPAIDFRHETVIASVAGPQPSSCFGIRIDAIERLPGRAVAVGVAHIERSEEICGCLAVFTNPVVAVVVSGPIGAVEFVHEDVPTTGCGCGFGIAGGDVQTQCGFAIEP